MHSGHTTTAIPEESTSCLHQGVAVTGDIYTTADLAPEDRLHYFDRLQVASEHPMRFVSDAPQSFGAHARALDLGAVNVVDLHCSPAQVVRTPQLVRRLDPELVSVVLARSGQLVVAQGGREAVLKAGDLALYSSSQPFQINIDSDNGAARLVRAHMPRSLLSTVVRDLDETLARSLPGQRGVGALLGQFLTRVTDDSEAYVPGDLPRLGNLAVDLLTATLSHEFDAPASSSPIPTAILPRIIAFARQHLHDPQLSPTTIAAEHHISVSYLHRLFQRHETTLAAWIRQERLDRARRDLTDPRLRHLPVHRIAARWGYQDHATFTRAFRATFGVPPRDFRNHVTRLGASEDADEVEPLRPIQRRARGLVG